MAQKNTSGTNTKPRLVVKIIGSKQVKQFIQEPQEETRDTSKTKADDPPIEDVDGDFEKTPEKQNVTMPRTHRLVHDRVDSALWAVINQVPNRICVTAPSGDRSRSYIHPQTLHIAAPRAAAVVRTTEQRRVSEDRDKAELSWAVKEELSDWQLSSLRPAEVEVAALDRSFSGTLSRSQITHLFLKNDVPLKLPTFSLLLQMFSDKDDSDQVHYRNLLQFIRSSAFPKDPQSHE